MKHLEASRPDIKIITLTKPHKELIFKIIDSFEEFSKTKKLNTFNSLVHKNFNDFVNSDILIEYFSLIFSNDIKYEIISVKKTEALMFPGFAFNDSSEILLFEVQIIDPNRDTLNLIISTVDEKIVNIEISNITE